MLEVPHGAAAIVCRTLDAGAQLLDVRRHFDHVNLTVAVLVDLLE